VNWAEAEERTIADEGVYTLHLTRSEACAAWRALDDAAASSEALRVLARLTRLLGNE
jgi:hypothetical protein